MTGSVVSIPSSDVKVRTNRWMEDCYEHIADKRITEIAIPGTHDSATYHIHRRGEMSLDAPRFTHKIKNLVALGHVTKQVTASFAKCQNHTIKQQLDGGIRYLDIRIQPKPCGKDLCLFTVHSMFSTPFDVVVEEINMFLEENPMEIVIMDVQHVIGMEEDFGHEMFVRSMRRVAHHLMRREKDLVNIDGVPVATIAELLERKERLLVLYPDPRVTALGTTVTPKTATPMNALNNFIHPRTPASIISKWHNTTEPRTLMERLDHTFADRCSGWQRRRAGQLFVAQAVLTANNDVVKNSIIPDCACFISNAWSGDPLGKRRAVDKIRSTFDLARKANEVAVQWWTTSSVFAAKEHHPHSRNIIIVDFYEHSNVVSSCINLNVQLSSGTRSPAVSTQHADPVQPLWTSASSSIDQFCSSLLTNATSVPSESAALISYV